MSAEVQVRGSEVLRSGLIPKAECPPVELLGLRERTCTVPSWRQVVRQHGDRGGVSKLGGPCPVRARTSAVSLHEQLPIGVTRTAFVVEHRQRRERIEIAGRRGLAE